MHLRLRSQHASGATTDSVGVEQRTFTIRTDPVTITAGNFYQTLGRGLLLRAYENRFVNLGRSDRSFSLDRDIDGIRIQGEFRNVELTALSGRPRLTVTSGGSATPQAGLRVDLVQGFDAKGYLPGDRAWLGVSVLGLERRSLARRGDPTPEQTMRGVRAGADTEAASLYVEWADIRWATELVGLKDSRALYGEVTASHGDFGVSVELKDYNNFASPYSEPPTLVRTHSSVLLNAATHVMKPTEEGVQIELIHTPNAQHTTTANLTGAWSEFFGNTFRFRELFAEHRFDGGAVDAGVFADWAEDDFSGDRNRWAVGLSTEIQSDAHSVFVDGEWQRIDPEGTEANFSNAFLQSGYSRAGILSVALRFQWTTRPSIFGDRTQWLGGTLNVQANENHSVFVFAGARPPGLVCSGGFCFFAPEFEGLELRLLTTF